MPVPFEPMLLSSGSKNNAAAANENESSSSAKRKMLPSFTSRSRSSSINLAVLQLVILTILICDLSSPVPVTPSPLPSSSAWSLPTLNYLFKDTKTRSQSIQYQKDSQIQNQLGRNKAVVPQSGGRDDNQNQNQNQNQTGRLISAHDIRLTDNWGWVRRGVSDPTQTTEQRRKQSRNNIRHSKSKHKQRHYPSETVLSSTSSKGGKKKEKMENLLCPFDEIRGPDGKCRKAPRFSLYRVGRK